MSDRFKFRQILKPYFAKMLKKPFHYWGYIDDGFVSPLGKNEGGESYQCTGLKDKNGVLIYEGDAWVTKESIDNVYGESAGWLKFIRVVKWSDELACFVIYEYSEDPNMETDIYPLNEFGNNDGPLSHFNVTHNIHKNPELLELTND